MKGSCHCGRIAIDLPRPPEYLNQCNCTSCYKLGTLWGYYTKAEVRIDGTPTAYRRADSVPPVLNLNFCDHCGCTTHWSPTEFADFDRMGVNMRLFDRADLTGVEVRYGDRLNHDAGEKRFHYREPTVFGEAGVTP
jgi:hypothetical protein